MNESTRKAIEERDRQKASVLNVVTTHSDVAKVASGEEVDLVPTVNVYRQDDPTEGTKMEVQDPTVVSPLAGAGRDTTLDKAESSLAQPQGDEYSERSATGPTLVEGPAAETEEETKPAHDPEATDAERAETSRENARKATEAAAEEVEKDSERLTAEAEKAESQGDSGVAGEKSTDADSGSPAAKTSSSKSSSKKTSTKKSSSKGKGK